MKTSRRNRAVLIAATLTVGVLGGQWSGRPALAAAPQPTVHYTFDGALTDAKGGSTLKVADPCPADPCNATSEFGSDADGTYWHWTSSADRGGGFTIDTTANLGTTYTVALKFSFADVDYYRKIIDYKNRESDNGFYYYDATLLFYPFSESSPEPYPANTVLDLIAVRQATDGDKGTFTVYAVGADGSFKHLFTSQDDTGESIPHTNASGGTTLGFFFDDIATSSEAAREGKVYDLRMWPNASLSEEEVKEAVSPPLPPTGVTASAGDGQATVNWTASASATSYRVTAEPGGAGCTATAPETSCVVEGLANGTSYTFTVVAIGDGGTSDPSQPSAAVTPAAPPTTTTSVTAPPAPPEPVVTTTTIRGKVDTQPAGNTGPQGTTAGPGADSTTTTTVGSGGASADTTDRSGSGTLPRTGESGTQPASVGGATLIIVGLVLLATFRRRRHPVTG